MKQRSPEWYEARRGVLTASRIGRLMGGTSVVAGLLATIERELKEGPGGWLEGQDQADLPNLAHGRRTEPFALDLYMDLYEVTLEEVGFLPHPTLRGVGASPDAMVVEPGMALVLDAMRTAKPDDPVPAMPPRRWCATVEVKCPVKLHRHQAAAVMMPAEHGPQVQTQAFCAGVDQARFLSYFEDTAPELQLYVHRIAADTAYHDRLAERVEWFWRVFDGKQPLTLSPPIGAPNFF